MEESLTLTGYELISLGFVQIGAFLLFELIARGISVLTEYALKKLKLRKEDKQNNV